MKHYVKTIPIIAFGLLLLTISSSINAAPPLQTGPAQQCIEGLDLFFSGEPDAALPLLEAGFANRDNGNFNYPGDLGRCALALGFLRHNFGKRNDALEAYAVAVMIFQQSGETWFEGLALNNMGEIYYELGEYQEALTKLNEALTIIQKEGDPVLENTALNNIGLVYHEQGRIEEAWVVYQKALSIAQKADDLAGESSIQNNIGEMYRTQGRFEEALTLYHKSLAIARELGDRISEGVTLNNIAQVYRTQGRYEEALLNYQEALTIMQEEGDLLKESTALNNIAAVYVNMGRYEEALAQFHTALAITQDVSYRGGEGITINNIGDVYTKQGRYEEALIVLQEALAILQEVGDKANEGTALNNIALVYGAQGQYNAALTTFEEAISIWREIENREGEAVTLNNIGGMYRRQGRYEEALAKLQESLVIRQEVSDRAGESETLSNIGTVYTAWGRFAEALIKYHEALAIAQSLGIRAGEGTILNNIGQVYNDQGRPEEALVAFEDALIIHREVGNQADAVTTLNNIGAVYLTLNETDKALAVFQEALILAQNISDRAGEGILLSNVGQIYNTKGQTQEALQKYEEALAIAQEVGNRSSEGTTLNNIGSAYLDQGQIEEALTTFQESLVIYQEIGDRTGEGIVLKNIGFAYELLEKPGLAGQHYEQALAVLELVRAVAGSDAGRTSFIAQYSYLYDDIVSLYHQQGQENEVFFSSERGRSRAFLDALSTRYVELNDNEDRILLDRELEAYTHRQVLQEALAVAQALDPPDAELVASLEMQLADADAAHNEASAAIEARGGQLAALVPGRSTVLTLPEVQGLLADGETMVYFIVLEDQTLVFLITRVEFEVVEIEVTRENLTERVSRFRDLISFLQTDVTRQEAQTLYQLLFAPLAPSIHTERLIIVPHGALHYLPFAALLDRAGDEFLIEQYTLSILPSASVLPFIQDNAADQGGDESSALILGNPAVEYAALDALPFAEQEAETIAAFYNDSALTGETATETAVRQNAPFTNILHLAAHGEYNFFNPLYSTIYLAPDVNVAEPNEMGDGRLEVHEIYGLDLQAADLVVLSACQTQLGELSAGDELVGLTRAFFFAGTPSVVATLWNVDDAATSVLMERFYTHLDAGMSKADALRQAQLDMLAEKDDPFFWAGFVLSGDGGQVTKLPHTSTPIKDSQLPFPWGWLIVSLILFFTGGGILWRQQTVPKKL